MRALLLAMAAGVALSGCQTDKIDTAIETQLPKVCSDLATADLAFTGFAAVHDVKQSTIAKEIAAYQGAQVICSDPSHTTLANALVLAAQAYAVVASALHDAKTAS